MSKFYLASDPRSLADQLADALDDEAKTGDFFAPTLVVVPNRYLRKWLRLWLARKLDVAVNLNYQPLEEALWTLLRQVDPNQSTSPPEAIDENTYRLMVLSVLLEEQDPDLAPLQRYLQRQGPALSRLSCRRAWYLADRLGVLLQDYEYHRQDALIQRWLRNEIGLGAASDFHKMMERAQRALFQQIIHEPDGKRALLNRLSEKSYKTFPQYAMELMTKTGRAPGPRRCVHFFGFTQVSDLHARTIGWLGQHYDIRFYHLNALASRLPTALDFGALKSFVRTFREEKDESQIHDMLCGWGRAGLESLDLLANGLDHSCFTAEALPVYESPTTSGTKKRPTARSSSVLGRLQDQLLGKAGAKARLSQDTSLQIVGCPGIAREVETVYNSILHNLQKDPSLRQTDIAVLVTDMLRYRAPLQAVFERPPMRLQYNMVDFNAAGLSMFGQALLGMLDLALESFSRSRVFEVLLNPCFLARLGVDRAQAMTWLEWAQSLGIYQGWDADEKQQQGYAHSPFYAWRLGLQRLRLGRYMEVAREDADEPAARFGHVIPFADLASTECEHLDAFCKAVEGLLPTLARLRTAQMTGQRWANVLQRLMQEFLDVPADRPEEAQVRDELLAATEKLTSWDYLHDSSQRNMGTPLALVREYVQGQLQMLPGNRGEYLIGGVTVSALQPMRPVPFSILYVLGLGDDLFPGSNALSSFDLRGAQRLPGDIRPAEERLYDFLTTVLAAQRKLYLLYNNHDLQKDQALLPAIPLQQLQRYLGRHVLKSEFEPTTMPMHADDRRYLDAAQHPGYQDVLTQYHEVERCLAIRAAERDECLVLDPEQQAEWLNKWASLQKDFTIPPEPQAIPTAASTVSLYELRRFLHFPAHASLRRHLRVEEEEEQTLDNEEPLITPQLAGYALIRQTLQKLVLSASQGDLQQALTNWQERFAETYADSRLRCQVPEEAFGEIDQAALLRDLQERIHGQGQIATFLQQHAEMTFCGPVLLGESMTPLGARLRFPALRLRPGHAAQEIRLVGWTPFAWQSSSRFEILIVTNSKEIDGREIAVSMIEPALFHLAMLANAEPNADGVSPQQWLAQREVVLHAAHRGGIQTWSYPPGSITPTEASRYLAELARDFLDPAQFDLMPFDILCKNKELQLAFHEGIAPLRSPDVYRTLLEEVIADERESTFSFIEFPLLVDMIRAQVPADALAKVQRRFQLLDRGPARNRQQPTKVRRGAKP